MKEDAKKIKETFLATTFVDDLESLDDVPLPLSNGNRFCASVSRPRAAKGISASTDKL